MAHHDSLALSVELLRLLDLVRAQGISNEELAARVYDLTTVLFENPIARAALDSVAAHESELNIVEESLRRELCQEAGKLMDTLLDLIKQFKDPVWPSKAEGASKAAKILWDYSILGTLSPAESIERTCRHEQRDSATIEELKELAAATSATLRAVSELADDRSFTFGGFGNTRDYLETTKRTLEEGQKTLSDGFEKIFRLKPFASAAMRKPTIAWLRSFHDEMAALREGRVHGLYRSKHSLLDVCQYVQAIERLVSALRARISITSVQSHLVDRLVAYLERFGKDDLVRDLEAKCLNSAKRKRKEDVVQEHVDRFLFLEGAFPITHAVAGGGGFLDTHIDDATRPLFRAQLNEVLSEAERVGAYPLLLELKQAITLPDESKPDESKQETESSLKRDKGSTKLSSIADEARAQANEYKKTMQAYPQWSNLEVFVLVVYNGKRQGAPAMAGNVRFAYVGDEPPSKARPGT